ncbi:MAG: ion transporter [Myxococcota bacterium]
MESRANIRRRTHEVLEIGVKGDELSRTIDLMIMGLVLGNVIAVIFESVPSIRLAYHDLFIAFEKISVAAFSAEFLARVWSVADDASMGSGPLRRRLNYLRSPMAIVDVLAIAPFYLSAFFALDLRFLRVLRLLRIVKLTRYSAALGRLVEVYRLQRAALTASFFVMAVAIVLSASFVYVVENRAQPVAFGSIPAAMWWAVCTLTTVGYGDVTPITPVGKVLASAIQMVGIAMVALPTSLFASGFAHIMNRNEEALKKEAREALSDGIVTDDEAAAYALLADQLHVEPEVAREIIAAAQQHYAFEPRSDCPHCGKDLASA